MTRVFSGFSTYERNHKNNKLTNIELIKRDLLNHFHTRKGERVMNPTFGSIIWDMLYEPMTQANKDLIEEDVLEVIASEPRVELENIQVDSTESAISIYINLFFVPFNEVGELRVSFDRGSAED